MAKYGNKKTVYDNIIFDSIVEMRRYKELKLLEKSGQIMGLELQPKFELQPAYTDRRGKKHKAITYIGDFKYLEKSPPPTTGNHGLVYLYDAWWQIVVDLQEGQLMAKCTICNKHLNLKPEDVEFIANYFCEKRKRLQAEFDEAK